MLKIHTWHFTSSSLKIVWDLEHEQATTGRYMWRRKKLCEICRIFFSSPKSRSTASTTKLLRHQEAKHDDMTAQRKRTHMTTQRENNFTSLQIFMRFLSVCMHGVFRFCERKTIRKIKVKLDTLGCCLTVWEKSLLHNISERHHENGAEAYDEIRNTHNTHIIKLLVIMTPRIMGEDGKTALWHLMFGRALVVSSTRLQMFGWSVSKFKSDSTHLWCPKCCWCCSPNCPLMAECCCMLSFPMNFSSYLNIEVQALRWRRHVPMSWDDYSPNWVVSGCLDHQRLVPRFSVDIVK